MYRYDSNNQTKIPDLTDTESIVKGLEKAVSDYKEAVEHEHKKFLKYDQAGLGIGPTNTPLPTSKTPTKEDVFKDVVVHFHQKEGLDAIDELLSSRKIETVSNSNGFWTKSGVYLIVDEKITYNTKGIDVSLITQGRIHNKDGINPYTVLGPDANGIGASVYKTLASGINNNQYDSQTTTALNVSCGNYGVTMGEWYQFGPRLSQETQKGVKFQYGDEDEARALTIGNGLMAEYRQKATSASNFIWTASHSHRVLTMMIGVDARVSDYKLGAVVGINSKGKGSVSAVLRNNSTEVSASLDTEGHYEVRAGFLMTY